jgi:dTDP-4-dehydrorhamnose reductase
MTPRVLMTGAAGVVGRALAPYFARWYPGCVLTDRVGPAACDLESPADIARFIEDTGPNVVIHLAGNKDVFALEKEPRLAWKCNVDTTANLLEALRGRRAFMAYISTDYVFAGVAGPYRETSPAAPTTAYGKSKLAAEQMVLASGLECAVARSSSLYGFPGDLVGKVRETLARGQTFPAFSDLVSNPTAVGELAEMLRRIIDGTVGGTFHASGAEAMSRETFARRIAARFGLNAGLVRGETRDETIRPPYLSLDCSATYARLSYQPATLEATLRTG